MDMGVLEGEFSAFRVLWSPRFTGRGWPLPLAACGWLEARLMGVLPGALTSG